MSGRKRQSLGVDPGEGKVPRLEEIAEGEDKGPLQSHAQQDQATCLSGNKTHHPLSPKSTGQEDPTVLSEKALRDEEAETETSSLGASPSDSSKSLVLSNEPLPGTSQSLHSSVALTSRKRHRSPELDYQSLISTYRSQNDETEIAHTQDMCIGMTGGVNYGTTIGQNYGSLKQEFHEDERFKNICRTSEQMIMLEDHDEYVPTYAGRTALRTLQQFGFIFIKGRSGSGKSRLGVQLLAEMQKGIEERTPVVLTSSAQWDLIPNARGKYTVLIDNIFGSSNLVQSKVDDWIACFEVMWPSVKSGHIFLVVTSRPEIIAHCENRLKRFSIMTNVLWIDEGVNQLKDREKIRMLRRICGKMKFSKQQLLYISHLKTKLGFPQCCKYFANSKEAQDKGVSFFENPHEYIVKEVRTKEECGDVQYLCLLLVLKANGCLTEKDLTHLVTAGECQQYCRNLPPRVTLADVKHCLESLCGVYLRKHGVSYEFQHQSVYDAVFISLSSKWPGVFISMCPEQILLEFVTIPGVRSDTVICIDEHNYDILADRMTELMLSSDTKTQISVTNHPSLKEDRFVQYLFDRWREQGRLLDITSKKCKFTFSSEGISLQMLMVADICGPECCYLCSLMVMKMFHKLVNLLMSRCQLDVDVLQEMLMCAVVVGDNDLIQSLMNKVEPHKNCLKALCFSRNIHENITEKIFSHLVSSSVHLSRNHDTSFSAQWEAVEGLKNLLLMALVGHNSHFIFLLVTMLTDLSVSKDFFEKCLIHLFKKMSASTYMDQQTASQTVKITEIFLNSAGSNIDADYLTWLAAGHPDSRCLKMILKKDIDVCKKFNSQNLWRKYPEEMTSLDRAVFCGGHDCLSELINNIRNGTHKAVPAGSGENSFGIATDDRIPNLLHEQRHLLLLAAEIGEERKMRILIEAGMSVNVKDVEGDTSLHKAVKCSSLPCVKILLAAHADVNVANVMGKIPLMCTRSDIYACIEIVKELIKVGSEVNHVDNHRNTALNQAVINNDIELVKCLVENNADLNYEYINTRKHVSSCLGNLSLNKRIIPTVLESTYYGTTLHLACRHSDVELVQFLCEHGANLFDKDEHGQTVIHKAARSSIDAVEKLQYLQDVQHVSFNNVDYGGRTPLFSAVRTGNTEVIAYLINEGLNINHIADAGYNVVMFAVWYSNKNIVKYLLEKGANPLEQDWLRVSDIFTSEPGELFERKDEFEALKLLQEKAFTPSMADRSGRTALHWAIKLDYSDCVQLLLEKGFDACAQDKVGKTALHYAAEHSTSEIIELLLDKGADPFKVDNTNRTVLHRVADRGLSNIIKRLLEKGADPCVQDSEGMTALHYAARKGCHYSIKLLLENDVDPSVQDNQGRTVLHYAVTSSSSDGIKLLLDKETDLLFQDSKGKTALHNVVQNNTVHNVKLILDKGCDPCIQDQEGRTALHFAASRSSIDIISLVLEKWPGPCWQDNDDKTTAEINHRDTTELLFVKDVGFCVQDKEGKTALHYASERAYTESIRLILEKGSDPSVQDREGKTALHYAAESACSDSIKLLLEKGSDLCVQDKNGKTALHYATERDCGDGIKVFLDKDSDPCEQDKEGKTAIHYAAARGSSDCVKLLLEKAFDPGQQDNEGKTALHHAVKCCRSDNAQLLLEKGCDLSIQDKEGKTALHYAALFIESDPVKLLIEKAADPSIQDKEGKTALHYAVSNMCSDSVRILIGKGADPSIQDKEGKTTLHYAVSNMCNDSVKILIEKGADPSIQDKEGKTTLHYAVSNMCNDSVKLLIGKGADPSIQDKEGKTALHYAVSNMCNDSIKILIEKGADPSIQDKEGKTALHYVSWETHSDSVKLLIEKGADPSIQDKEGKTALHYAVSNMRNDIVKILIEKGADPSIQDKEGKTALHCVSRITHSDHVNLLIEKGADPSIQDKEGRTALHYAVSNMCNNSVKILIEKGADPSIQDKEGRTALHYAALCIESDHVKLLIEKGADPSIQDKEGKTALHYVSRETHSDHVNLLIEKGADPSIQDKEGKTALHYAVINMCNDSVKILIEKGADPSIQDKEGKTALHYVSWRTHSDSVKLLIWKGADPSIQDKEGRTALHYAVSNMRNDSVKILIEKGADPSIQDKEGKTALHYAALCIKSYHVKLLIEKGADASIKDKEGKTALHYAACTDGADRLKLLLDKGGDPGLNDRTFLHYAADNIETYNVKSDNIKLLLEKGADPCEQDKEGKTALHYASHRLDSYVMKLLLEKVVDPFVQDIEGKTALHYAADNRWIHIIKRLLEKRADPCLEDKRGKTALHYASVRGTFATCNLLIGKGSNPSVQDKNGKTPLHYAAENGKTDITRLLLEKGTSPCVQDKERKTPLHYAAESGRTDIAKLFLEKGTDSCVQDKEGKTPLHYAAETGRTDIAKLFLEKGTDSCVQDKEGKTPLHYAAESGRTDITKLLLKKVANHSEQDKEGKTPLHKAVDIGET